MKTKFFVQFKDYYGLSKEKHYRHKRAAEYYNKFYYYTMTPVIIVSSITTVLASYNSTTFINTTFSLFVAIFSGLTTIGQALNAFFEFSEKKQAHKSSANRYLNLSRVIEVDLCTIKNNESVDRITDFLNKIKDEFASIEDSSLLIPIRIQNLSLPKEITLSINNLFATNKIYPTTSLYINTNEFEDDENIHLTVPTIPRISDIGEIKSDTD